MAMYIAVERGGKWEVLFSHVNGDDLIKRCDTEEQAETLIRVLETGHNAKNPQIDDIFLDADDALVDFLNECDIDETEAEEGSKFFIEGFNRGQEAMRAKVLTLLGEMKDGV